VTLILARFAKADINYSTKLIAFQDKFGRKLTNYFMEYKQNLEPF